jgi:hypothetical protein
LHPVLGGTNGRDKNRKKVVFKHFLAAKAAKVFVDGPKYVGKPDGRDKNKKTGW